LEESSTSMAEDEAGVDEAAVMMDCTCPRGHGHGQGGLEEEAEEAEDEEEEEEEEEDWELQPRLLPISHATEQNRFMPSV